MLELYSFASPTHLCPISPATHRYVLKPAATAAWRLVALAFQLAVRIGRLLLRLYRLLLLPVLRVAGDVVRRFLAPLLWPAGSVAGTWWFARQALLQSAPLPFGAAAAMGGVVVCLMAGKSMRVRGLQIPAQTKLNRAKLGSYDG